MPEKKTRVTPTRRNEKTGVGARRKYTEGNLAQCSVDKRGSLDTTAPKTAAPNQSKFVHQSSKAKASDSSEHSKPANKKQLACRKWFNQVKSMGLREIRREFIESIKPFTPDLPTSAFNDEANANKNRYDDVLLLDKSRIKIKINPDDDDYIHASKVEVHSSLSYICTQGPLLNTIPQFWLMCIQEEAKVILQLCMNVEDDKEKCNDYMPKEIGEWATYGPVQVKVIKSGALPAAKKVTKSVVKCKFDDKEITIHHVLYYGWPDHGVPESVPTCREVRTLVQKLCEKKPIVLHCSAGIGRTGTFAAIEMVCNKLLNEHDGDFKMIDLMQELRRQRAQAVQNDQQYSFIYRAVIEILIAEEGLTKSPEVAQFIQSYEEMVMRKKKQLRTSRASKTSKRN